ncbi:sensor histidine kinase [Fodinibius salsisoli]|uniref:Histidine kinase n=1 Tax=Fodinibius salsisoli TaxID=2820877 RepID=A0ABT3PJ61_9BACT|nr:histidine kinase [Fodinibius salsisoli]MCW9705978.1 histidine kinase [Fodinibius salsisoli]
MEVLSLKKKALKLLMVGGIWGIVILLISLMTLFSFFQEGTPIGVIDAIIFEFWCIIPWIVSTPILIWLARTYRFKKQTLYTSMGIHLVAAVILFSLHCLVQSYTVSHYFDITFGWSYLKRDFLGFLDMRVMLYAGVLLVVYSIDFYRKNKEIELEEPLLKAKLNKAKFHAILNQVQPDFLLNSIELVNKSLDTSKEEAEKVLTDFSDLLRIMLANIEREQVTIREDLRSYFLYASLLQKRLGHDIQIKTNIDQECFDDLIPPFLVLIPLLEEVARTIKHTAGTITEISYNAYQLGDEVQLEAVIKGKGILAGPMADLLQVTGITEVMGRLEKEYGKEVQLTTKGLSNEIRVSVILPLKKVQNDYETMFLTNANGL